MNVRTALPLLLSIGCSRALPLHAQQQTQPTQPTQPTQLSTQTKAPKFPLRLHVLAIDQNFHTVRMQPQWGSGAIPDESGSSGSSGPGTASLGGGSDDLSGSGRADLVTPPNGTIGLNFTYEGCSRVRVAPGFSGLQARWIKPGVKLQILLPTDEINDGTPRPRPCTLKVVPQSFVYLRLPSGSILRVTQQAFAAKPALRSLLSGGNGSLERRQNVISVKDLAQSNAPQPALAPEQPVTPQPPTTPQ